MGESSEPEPSVRLPGLGNEILADDAFGIAAAREAAHRFSGALDVMVSSEAGFNLIDHLLGASRLLVVDTIVTGVAKPGTLHVFEEAIFRPTPRASPHRAGLFEVLAAAQALGLPAPPSRLCLPTSNGIWKGQMHDPRAFWLILTNILLGAAVLILILGVLTGVLCEAVAKWRRRRGVSAELDDDMRRLFHRTH